MFYENWFLEPGILEPCSIGANSCAFACAYPALETGLGIALLCAEWGLEGTAESSPDKITWINLEKFE